MYNASSFCYYVTNDQLNLFSRLSELEKFIKEATAGLGQVLREGNLPVLISVMSFLQAVKERIETTDKMFEPIKEYIDLLKTFDYELPEAVFVQLEELPFKWEELKKQAVNIRTQVAPLQAQEVYAIKKRIGEFDTKQNAFRDGFRSYSLFE